MGTFAGGGMDFLGVASASLNDSIAVYDQLVGDTLNLSLIFPVCAPNPNSTTAGLLTAPTLVRRPGTSSAAINGSNQVTLDKPGWYQFTVSNAGTSIQRAITVIAFPTSFLTLPVRASNPQSAKVPRAALRTLANDPRLTTPGAIAQPAVVAFLEGAATVYPTWLNWADYANE